VKLKCTYVERTRPFVFTAGRKQNVTSHVSTANKRTIYHQPLKFYAWVGMAGLQSSTGRLLLLLLDKCVQREVSE